MTYVSVIVPTYKPGTYLFECLESLHSQSLPKNMFEVILVLNGCDEPYKSEIKKWQEKHQKLFVNLVHTTQGGVSNARNIALDCSDGEYITFLDDDDYVSPTYLEELLSKADKETISLCYPLSFIDGTTRYEPFNITNDYYKYSKIGKVLFYKPKRFFAGPVYKLIHRDIIDGRRFDVRFKNCEDSLFMFLISDKMKNVEFTSMNAIYYRRVRQNSASSNESNLWFTLKNRKNLIKEYSKIYFNNRKEYKFSFYWSMVFSSIKKIIYEVLLRFS